MIATAIYVLAVIGALCVATMAGFALMVARDLWRQRRARIRHEAEHAAAQARERDVLDALERDLDGRP